MRDYVLASWAGTLPGRITLRIPGLARSRPDAGSDRRSEARSPAEWLLYAVGLLATIVVAVYVTRVSNRALKQIA